MKAIVRITLSGARREDFRRAQAAWRAMLGKPSWEKTRGWIWHHLADGATLQLIPEKLHGTLPHTGSFTSSEDHSVQVLGAPASPLPLTDAYPPPSPETLRRFEATIALPPAYRAFLMHSNGGKPRVAGFRGEETGDETLDHFLGLAPGEPDDLVAFLTRYGDQLPPGLLPVAYDSFGNLICLVVEGEDYGSVVFHDHEAGAVRRIAPDFEAFLGTFREDR